MIISKREFLLTMLFPARCPFCGHFMESHRCCCPECELRLPVVKPHHLCSHCGQFHCICRGEPLLKRLYVPFFYSGSVIKAIQNLKFNGNRSASRPLGKLMAQCIRQESPEISFDCVVPIPMTRRDLQKRGYSQSKLLAKFIGRELHIPVEHQSLIKIRQTPKQHTLNARQRQENLAGAFTVQRPEVFRGKSVLLCDDVTTTGSTLREAANTLRLAGVREVSAIVLATTEKLEQSEQNVIQ